MTFHTLRRIMAFRRGAALSLLGGCLICVIGWAVIIVLILTLTGGTH